MKTGKKKPESILNVNWDLLFLSLSQWNVIRAPQHLFLYHLLVSLDLSFTQFIWSDSPLFIYEKLSQDKLSILVIKVFLLVMSVYIYDFYKMPTFFNEKFQTYKSRLSRLFCQSHSFNIYSASLFSSPHTTHCFLNLIWENSLTVQWLGLHISTAGDTGVIPDQGTKVPHAMWHNQK